MELFTISNDIKNEKKIVNILLDGAHNEYSIRVLLNTIKSRMCDFIPSSSFVASGDHSEVLVLFGAGADKSVDQMIISISELADKIIFTRSNHFKALGTNK